MVPLAWAASAAKATRTRKALVWILLLHTAWRTKSATFPLSNACLAKSGVSREIKRRYAGGTGSRRTNRSRVRVSLTLGVEAKSF